MLVIFIVIIQDMPVIRSFIRPNLGKQSVSLVVVDIWQDVPTSLQNLNTFTFSGKVRISS